MYNAFGLDVVGEKAGDDGEKSSDDAMVSNNVRSDAWDRKYLDGKVFDGAFRLPVHQ